METIRSTAHMEPKLVPWLIQSCDTDKPTGMRDRAILLLLVRLGLRPGDIVTMRLDDIEWIHGTIRVRGKSRQEVRLPLPQDAGDALLTYLEKGRPQVPIKCFSSRDRTVSSFPMLVERFRQRFSRLASGWHHANTFSWSDTVAPHGCNDDAAWWCDT